MYSAVGSAAPTVRRRRILEASIRSRTYSSVHYPWSPCGLLIRAGIPATGNQSDLWIALEQIVSLPVFS